MSDTEITEKLGDGDIGGATEALLLRHGEALRRFVHATVLEEALGEEIFQEACVEIWRALPSFSGRSSVRTWAYVITRRTTFRALKDPKRWRTRRLETSEGHRIAQRISSAHSGTWRGEDAKHWLWEAVGTFPALDRAIVALRIAHGMEWLDIARVLAEDSAVGFRGGDELEKSAAALRKRYERLKKKLRELHAGRQGP